ncbi:MAG: hypothetical protein H6546_02775 [Chitinophagales bacterium]|nr:hypothetical protein [Chitinophagales bacterium]
MKRSILIALLGLLYTTAPAQTVGQLLLSGGFSFVSGYTDGVSETLKFNYTGYKRIHPGTNENWSNPNLSWTNKWAKDGMGNPIVGKEAFLGSSSIFVGITDHYHLMRTVSNTTASMSVGTMVFPVKACQWWELDQTQFLKMRWEKAGKKPIFAYVAEFGWLTLCRGAGFTTSWNWIYGGN